MAGSDTEASQAGSADWSTNLLKLTKKKRKKPNTSGDGPPDGVEVVFSSEDDLGPSSSGRMLDDNDDVNFDDFGPSEGGRMVGERKKLPAAVRCFDTARIYVKSGDGGAGCVAFR